MWFIEGYFSAVIGSFFVRVLVWLSQYSIGEILQELRLGWKEYLKEDVCWAGIASLKYLVYPRTAKLTNRDDILYTLVWKYVPNEYKEPKRYGFYHFEKIPASIRLHALQCASNECTRTMHVEDIERIVRHVENSRRAVRKASLATCIAVWVASPLKVVTQLICGEMPVLIRMCCVLPLSREKVLPRVRPMASHSDTALYSGDEYRELDGIRGSHQIAFPCVLIIELVTAFIERLVD